MRAQNPRIPRLAALLPLLAGCAGAATRATETPAPWPDACLLAAAAGPSAAATGAQRADRPVRVALPGPLGGPRGPSADAAPGALLRQLYATLVEVDCEGHVRPGLAASWSHDEEGKRWRFTLRPEARFWDGSPVTAEAVARAWLAGGAAGGAAPGVPRIVSASATGPLELSVHLREPSRAPERFARLATAIRGEGEIGGWPTGSGPWRPTEGPGPRGRVDLVAVSGEGGLTFVAAPGGDGRAALDAGADVMVSSDPAVLAYARALPGDLGVVPLPWSRTYVLAATEGHAWGQEAVATAPLEALEALARGAVRAEARPARPPYWWREGGCGGGPLSGVDSGAAGRPAQNPDAPPRIAYPLGDAAARGIAERLVALAGRGSAVPAWLITAVEGLGSAGGRVVAAGLDPATLARAVERDDALAFVVPVPRAPGGVCVSGLLAAEDEVGRALFRPGAGLRLTPLVDVRPSLVLRPGVRGIALDGDGTLRFLPAGTPGGGER